MFTPRVVPVNTLHCQKKYPIRILLSYELEADLRGTNDAGHNEILSISMSSCQFQQVRKMFHLSLLLFCIAKMAGLKV